jgi:T4 RnlA family RNA ligase
MNSITELYENLMRLTDKVEAFYYVDQELDNRHYRIFLYRLASYTEFLNPGAMDARGTMFELLPQGKLRLACRPFKKFFNLNENPFTMGLDFSENKIEYITEKLDGSLVSTFMHYRDDGSFEMRFKTKGTMFSEQALAARSFLDESKNVTFKDSLEITTQAGFTVNMEYTAPDNRIVLGYQEPGLTVLGVNKNDSGFSLSYQLSSVCFPKHMVPNYLAEAKQRGITSYLLDVKNKSGVEGVVIKFHDGLMVKVKADEYVALHLAKDGIHAPRRLYEAIVREAGDDLRQLFVNDPWVLARIKEMEEKVLKLMNETIHTVETFHVDNKHLTRKEYAIKGQQELDKRYFPLAMAKFLGQEIDYKGFLIKHYKEFGIKDEKETVEE